MAVYQHLIIDIVRVMEAFITQANTSLHGASKYYGDLASPLHLSKSTMYGLQTLLGDGAMVWRYYIVYDKRKAIIFAYGPLLLGSAVAIAYRILSRRLPETTRQSILPVAAIIIQSGALYASGVLELLITYLAGTNGQYAALDLCYPLVQRPDISSNTLSGRVSTARGSRTRARGTGMRVKNGRVDAEPSYAMQARIAEERMQYGDDLDMPKVDGEGSASQDPASLLPEQNERVIVIDNSAKHDSREFDHGAV
ncbi:hypothetical protein HETIRDRAFT_426754 [Heterobasidion irregulare TC 32-1]|uniref:Uncharacterized protein n=1 Tax=Heterobasidion irregulare (strain TC 32-1) TaxID=747525 RepID=W4K7H3_HETIT|nr:uncharacterized protein HETIRDRAFT_426754 [Heterobasidion irregulare TC 32-1]ETW81275.1 hypothetical protein HETIRDRAFT_426754 [Heterobasidion irregulare TC 32-1]